MSINRAEFLPVDFKHWAIVASIRHECIIRAEGFTSLLLKLFVSPITLSLFEDGHKDKIEKISETIVPSPPPLTTVVTGRELGKPHRTPGTIALCRQHLDKS